MCDRRHACTALFGVSKAAADLHGAGVRPLLRHEDGVLPRRLPDRPAATPAPQLHGFLAYLMRCAMTGDAVHGLRLRGQAGARQHPQRATSSRAFEAVLPRPAAGAVYNIGGGRAQQLLDARGDRALRGDHRPADELRAVRPGAGRRSSLVDLRPRRFSDDFPDWQVTHGIEDLLREILDQKPSAGCRGAAVR